MKTRIFKRFMTWTGAALLALGSLSAQAGDTTGGAKSFNDLIKPIVRPAHKGNAFAAAETRSISDGHGGTLVLTATPISASSISASLTYTNYHPIWDWVLDGRLDFQGTLAGEDIVSGGVNGSIKISSSDLPGGSMTFGLDMQFANNLVSGTISVNAGGRTATVPFGPMPENDFLDLLL